MDKTSQNVIGLVADATTGLQPPITPRNCAAAETVADSARSRRYLLVKAHVGFGDRLQTLSHAAHYAVKYGRTLCVDWSDSIWSDGTVNFDTFFEFCGVPTIAPEELLRADIQSVAPIGWINQLDRRADSKFIYRDHYVSLLEDKDNDAQVLVYGCTGFRQYYQDNLCGLRVRREFRDRIVAELKAYSRYRTVVHLRGTDRQAAEQYESYLAKIERLMGEDGPTEPLLVLTDCLPLYQMFQARHPQAILRTPNLEQFEAARGTHFQAATCKRDFNLQTLIDFFLLMYAQRCVSDGESLFSIMARFLRGGHYMDILGYDG